MNDDGEGKYSYSYTVSRPGEITINVLKYTQNGVYGEYYPNKSWSGTHRHQNISGRLSLNWGGGNVYSNVYDNVGAKYFFKLRPPISGAYSLSMYVDDNGILKLDGNVIMQRYGDGWTSKSKTLSSKFYHGSFYWAEGGGL